MKHPTIAERISELLIYELDQFELTEDINFSYEWSGGYEKLEISHNNRKGGSMSYSGTYHPGDGFCQGNPCKICGHTWIGDDYFGS